MALIKVYDIHINIHGMQYMLMSIAYTLNETKAIHLTSLGKLFHNFIETLIIWNGFILVLWMVPTILLINLISCKYYLMLKNEFNVVTSHEKLWIQKYKITSCNVV